MPLLTVQLDLIAYVREWQRGKEPDPAQAAVLAEIAGADGIAVHMREDRRLIRDRDLYMLREITKTRFIVETAPTEAMIDLMCEIKPAQVNLVTEGTDDLSPLPVETSGSMDYKGIVSRLNAQGMTVSLFASPQPEAIKFVGRSGAQGIILDSNPYCSARTLAEAQTELDRMDNLSQQGRKQGLSVSIMRGLSAKNIPPLAELGTIEEFIVGHALIARATLVGMETAVRDLLPIVRFEPSRK